MSAEEAEQVLRAAIWDDSGAFVQLRLGNDPGAYNIGQLRLALRVLWRHWKNQKALPYDITFNAANILHFGSEARANLRQNAKNVRQGDFDRELADLIQGAFDLLCGAEAESWVVTRPDLGE